MLLSFKVGKKDNKKNIRIENFEEMDSILSKLNQNSTVSEVKLNGEAIYNLNGLTIEELSEKIPGLLKNRKCLVITLHDNDFSSLLDILGDHLSNLYQYYSRDYDKEYCFLEYPLEELRNYSLEYIKNLYKLKKLISKTPEEIERILKYFDENFDIYLKDEIDALSIDGNGAYLLVDLFEDLYKEPNYQII